ncbi:Aste57867_14120 [Aphanomyces stellatus]|uniref:Aste57867_14120 protein n=1 Tax=Aphanomyces stellatus TaxID=120398 RepID=A0A485L0H9_9STRA|nr:hypothetical protein As57867_014069 [Aphanomyces stellatus]VFT90947.1 Aste57867_14120 [Aphanomyces stellatus]
MVSQVPCSTQPQDTVTTILRGGLLFAKGFAENERRFGCAAQWKMCYTQLLSNQTLRFYTANRHTLTCEMALPSPTTTIQMAPSNAILAGRRLTSGWRIEIQIGQHSLELNALSSTDMQKWARAFESSTINQPKKKKASRFQSNRQNRAEKLPPTEQTPRFFWSSSVSSVND